MCDDLGYGDVGFNGNEEIQTPALDALAAGGVTFSRFYAGGPVCSPTRGTCLTGRHYSRYGITHANVGRLPAEERTVQGILREHGYRTGHFGKWHLGTLTTSESDANRGGPESAAHYAPPWERGFERCFSTESKVPTWDPMKTPEGWGEVGAPFGTYYWDETGAKVEDNLDGCDSRAIMDRAEPFIRSCAASEEPFFAVIWFHAPHTPIVAGPEYLERYAGIPENRRHYYGCITAVDDQMGRLHALLSELGVESDTMLWFCSDNGPEGRAPCDESFNPRWARCCGDTGGLRGRKRSLYDGGVAVPAFLHWPAGAPVGKTVRALASTLDYLPTILDALEIPLPTDRPLDGLSLMPVVMGEREQRGTPIPYRFLESKAAMFGSPTLAMTGDRFKLLTNLSEDASEDVLFDMAADAAETKNVIAEHRVIASEYRGALTEFIDSCRRSHFGGDYDRSYEPVDPFQEVTGTWK